MADHNLITDIADVRVGNAHDHTALTGVTAIVFDTPTTASGTTRGGAPGTRDSDLLRPENSIQGVDGVLLSGGSIFGLDAAGGALAHLRQQGRGLAIGTAIVPVVTQAITFDLLNGGDKDWGRDPLYWQLGWNATENASRAPFALGSVGGGYGATTANFKGGLGSASAIAKGGIRVGAIAVVNAVGSATVGNGPHFWAAPYEVDREFGGRGLPTSFDAGDIALRTKGAAQPATTIGLVVTDGVLTKAQCLRLATMADDGLARAVRPSHAPMDGDTVFAVSTLAKAADAHAPSLMDLGALAADCLARAIARGVYAAQIPTPAYTGPPAYCDVHIDDE